MILTPANLGTAVDSADSATIDALVAGANAQAVRVAPCLVDSTDENVLAEARMVLIGAVKRWLTAGAGSITQMGSGPFQMSVDNRTDRTGYSLWPSEVATLRVLCDGGAGEDDEAFMVDMTSGVVPTLATRPDLWFQWVQPTPHGAP